MGTNPLHAMWSAAAPSWQDFADYVDDREAAVGEAMLRIARIEPGDDVLELGCGPGGVGLAAAELVGPDVRVVLSDVAPEMTTIAAERAERRGLRNVVTRELDMEHLDVPRASFDKVLCREALMLVTDPVAAATEARHVLRPEGLAVFAVWGPPTENPWLSALLDAVGAQLGAQVPPRGTPGPFALSERGALAAVLSAGGFQRVDVTEVAVPMGVESFDEWWRIVPSLAGPVAALLASLPDDMTSAIRADAEAALRPFRTDAGYDIPGLSFVGAGSP
ncbi:class I SAM-dependent methyltransferase [Mycobacterium sp. NPDC048908]|uniref:class I SAM-dependent methyltransferase n=1 Tax=Mycobacterium sp. NPDC048908 TaxID=3364292 RepID=UPI003724A53D